MVAAVVAAVVAAAVAAAVALAAAQAVVQRAAPELAHALAAEVVFVPAVVEDQLRNVEDSGGEIVSAPVEGLSSVK